MKKGISDGSWSATIDATTTGPTSAKLRGASSHPTYRSSAGGRPHREGPRSNPPTLAKVRTGYLVPSADLRGASPPAVEDFALHHGGVPHFHFAFMEIDGHLKRPSPALTAPGVSHLSPQPSTGGIEDRHAPSDY